MLYEEFRPKTFGEIIGQGVTPEILRNQVKNNKVAHSYIMTGNRGSGKTTSARILAEAVNCLHPKNGEPCHECENCKRFENGSFLDYQEIDAASNNGVDNIRAIIQEMQYGPQQGKYKIYVIDEAHMLSAGAVNAFLKILEEPPKYGMFILATTDPQKLPITIISRCQRFEFKRIQIKCIFERLRYVADAKKINIDDKSLNLIAKLADGAMRDALSLLEQTISLDNGKGIKYESVVEALGVSTNEKIISLISETISKDTLKILNILDGVSNEGKDLYLFLQELIKCYRNLLIAKVNKNCENLINAADEEINLYKKLADKISADKILDNIRILQSCERDFKLSSNKRTMLEMAFIEMTSDLQRNILLSKIEELNIKINNLNNFVPSPTAEDYKIVQSAENEHEENNQVLYEEEMKLTKSLREAKAFVSEKVKGLKPELSAVIDKSEIDLSGDILYIKDSDEKECEILISNIKNLTNGFSKFLEKPVEVQVTL